MLFFLVFLFFTEVASKSFIECGNDLSCPESTVCVGGGLKNGGAKYGCTNPDAGVQAVVCTDSRFSCPKDFVCDLSTAACVHANTTQTDLFENINAEISLLNSNRWTTTSTSTSTSWTSSTSTCQGSICSCLRPYIPSFCGCTDRGSYSGVLGCEVNILGLDEIDLTATLAPCDNPAYVAIEITEQDIGFDWQYKLATGTTEQIPIPGLYVDFYLATLGVYLDLTLQGNIAELEIDIAVDACGTILGVRECGADITSALPIDIIDVELDFSDICN